MAPNGGDSVKIYLKRWSKRVITIDKIIILILGGVVNFENVNSTVIT